MKEMEVSTTGVLLYKDETIVRTANPYLMPAESSSSSSWRHNVVIDVNEFAQTPWKKQELPDLDNQKGLTEPLQN